MIKKIIEAKVKSLEQGEFEIIASSGKQDRFGDTIDPKGWYLKNYKKNPVILWSHSSGSILQPAIPPVGKADKVWIEDEKELRIKGHFAPTPFAQELRALVEGGYLNAVSVGFLPLMESKEGHVEIDGKMYRHTTEAEMEKGLYGQSGEKFIKQELLEVSWVDVPALPGALISARKMNLALVTKALEEMKAEVEKGDEESFIGKPYPNEHSCRLENPDKYKRFRRQNCQRKHDGKCIDVIWGITKGEEEKTEQQALRYDKKVWTEDSAKTHCKDNKGAFEPASEKDLLKEQLDYIRSFISETEKAISVLKGFLPELDTTPTDGIKGRKPEKKIKSRLDKDREAEIKLLRLADKAIEALLRKLRQQK